MYNIKNNQLIISKPVKKVDMVFYIQSTNLYGYDEPIIKDEWYFDHSYRFSIVQICGYLYIYDSLKDTLYEWPLSQSVQNPIRELLDTILEEDLICTKADDQPHLLQCLKGGF